jgi:hypothetical protein
VKGSDGLTKVSGTLAAGGNSDPISLAPDTYNVYLYFATPHSCTWTQGQPVSVTDGGSATVSATDCN